MRYFIVLFLFFGFKSYASNDSTVEFSINYNIIQAQYDEHTITFELMIRPQHLFYFSVGEVYSNERKRERYKNFSSSQNRFPIFLYDGNAYRLGYNYVENLNEYFNLCFGAQFVYKRIGYFHEDLYDKSNFVFHENVHYNRTENTNVYGLDVTFGFRMGLASTLKLYIYPYAGLGYRIKNRKITTHESDNLALVPIGFSLQKMQYILPIIGLKVGIGIQQNK